MSDRPFPGVERATFIARVSAKLGRQSVAAPGAGPPAVDPSLARLVGATGDLIETFTTSATAAGMIVHSTVAAASDGSVLRLLADLGARHVAVADAKLLAGIAGALAAGREPVPDMKLIAWQDGPGVEPLYSCDAGVTDVQAAIAETGSLVCWSGQGRGRGLSLVPPVHVALVRRSEVIADLVDYWPGPAASAQPLPSSLVLITGPSKTADIEGILITGVHGPREVHIVLIEDL